MARSLDVYVDRRSNFYRMANYKLHYMLAGLRRANLQWRILERLPDGAAANAAFVHVDLTTLPQELRAVADKYAACINGRAISIDRRQYSRPIVRGSEDQPGPVIVKTILNSRGYPELRYESRAHAIGRVVHLARKLAIPDYKLSRCPPYEVFESLADVPRAVWEDDRLIVERFFPGSLNLPVTKNRLDFFLGVEMNSRSTYRTLLCHPESVEKTEVVSEVPEEVRDIQRRLQLDYGAVEYFVGDGEVNIIDVNKTTTEAPSWIERFPHVKKHMDQIAERLVEYVRAS